MRRVSIVISCDCCQGDIEEEVEGASAIVFTVRGEQREMDICDECLGGSFLQEARPVNNRKKRKDAAPGDFKCNACDKSFATVRGLNHHRTKMH